MNTRSIRQARSASWRAATDDAAKRAPRRRPGAGGRTDAQPQPAIVGHPLVDAAANARLHAYETGIKAAFDAIVPVLKRVSALRYEADFLERAQSIARAELGLDLPARLLEDAWIERVDMRSLFAWCVFATYRRVADEFYRADPIGGRDGADFAAFLKDCGFHALDITPCADGRLAHAISYVLRLPYGAVRRASHAGALFDIEGAMANWVETEFMRYREGRPNLPDEPTRYLKAVIYHLSSRDPEHEGCAAHGSDDRLAAEAGMERLAAFQQAIQNSFCCGASVDLLLIGMDTDTDAIRVHTPDRDGRFDLERAVDAGALYRATRGMAPAAARDAIVAEVRAAANGSPDEGMVRLVARLIENNLSQIDYVLGYHAGAYTGVGHEEHFICAGAGFEEIQIRNLTYFAHLDTVEEGAADLDIGIKIFSRLNVDRGLPAPVVVGFEYRGAVPGARERAIERSKRVARAIQARYPELAAAGLLHTIATVRDCDGERSIELIDASLTPRTGPLPGSLEASHAEGHR